MKQMERSSSSQRKREREQDPLDEGTRLFAQQMRQSTNVAIQCHRTELCGPDSLAG